MSSKCNRHQLALSAWIDEESDIDSTKAMFLHFAECENCRSFWRTSAAAEKQLLKEGRISGSATVDARIASIGQQGRLGEVRHGLKGRPNASFLDRTPSRGTALSPKESSGRTSFPYLVAAIMSVLAVSVGFILGWARTWPDNPTNGRELQVIYVSVLPNVMIVGNIPEQVLRAH